MFDIERFIADCREARADADSQCAVREVVARTVSDPAAVIDALGEPEAAGFVPLYNGPEMTILNFAWAPLMTLMPHNHNMWAVIGIYSGREDNIFWRRTKTSIEAAGAKNLGAGKAAALGKDAIHSVTNPIPRMTAALHVYGGDFFAPGRSEWDPETLTEAPFDVEKSRRTFAEASARFAT